MFLHSAAICVYHVEEQFCWPKVQFVSSSEEHLYAVFFVFRPFHFVESVSKKYL